MTLVSWALAVAWVISFLVIIHDVVEWQMKSDSVRIRQIRMMASLPPLLALEMLALISVIFPYLPSHQ